LAGGKSKKKKRRKKKKVKRGRWLAWLGVDDQECRPALWVRASAFIDGGLQRGTWPTSSSFALEQITSTAIIRSRKQSSTVRSPCHYNKKLWSILSLLVCPLALSLLFGLSFLLGVPTAYLVRFFGGLRWGPLFLCSRGERSMCIPTPIAMYALTCRNAVSRTRIPSRCFAVSFIRQQSTLPKEAAGPFTANSKIAPTSKPEDKTLVYLGTYNLFQHNSPLQPQRTKIKNGLYLLRSYAHCL
jgi:hypothetical protein